MAHTAGFWRKAARNFSTLVRIQKDNLVAVPNSTQNQKKKKK